MVENLQREDLNAIDRALAYEAFRDRFGLSPEQIGERVGEDRSTVTNYLRLLELPATIQDMAAGGLLSMGHARALVGVKDHALQLKLAKGVVLNSLSVRMLEDLISKDRSDSTGRSGKRRLSEKRPVIRDLERRFSEKLETTVIIRESRAKHRGRIIIQYNSLDDFDRICGLFGVSEQ